MLPAVHYPLQRLYDLALRAIHELLFLRISRSASIISRSTFSSSLNFEITISGKAIQQTAIATAAGAITMDTGFAPCAVVIAMTAVTVQRE